MSAHLELEHVRKTYGRVVAVDDVSLAVPRGTICGLLGPNGAGKTTTIRTIMRITLPDRGAVRLDGVSMDDALRERIGYLPEERGLYRKMKAADHLAFLAEVRGLSRREAKERAQSWLERLGLGDTARRKVEELSRGMQQKVQFAGAVIHDPELVILDEPFSGLDPIATRMLKDEVAAMRERGTTVLFSTHVMPQAEELCDHLCLINRGRVLLEGSLGEVRTRYGRPALELDTDADPDQLAAIEGVASVTRRNGALLVELGEGAAVEAFIRELSARWAVRSAAAVTASLEDIFLRAVEADHAAVA